MVDAVGYKSFWNKEVWRSRQFSGEYSARYGVMFEGKDDK
jgi:hypothetical protein